MKVIEILKISKETLKMLSENDIKMSDVKYLDMYSEYEKMIAKSLKVTYIVEHLSEEYGVLHHLVPHHCIINPILYHALPFVGKSLYS